MPVTLLTDEQFTLNGSNQRGKYPNPFFDLAQNYIPSNIKTLFKFCRDFYHTNGFLRNVITKLTEYPVTDILYDTSVDVETKKRYDVILHDKLKIKSLLIEIGLDYFTYGNSFITSMLIPKRFLKCSKCEYEEVIDKVDFKLKNFEFEGSCSHCGEKAVRFKAIDSQIKSIENFKLIRWAPENIDIDFNPVTGSATYYYTIPSKIKKLILLGNKTILKEIPLIFLEALKKKKRIELDPRNIFHLKYPTLAEEDMGWGKPLILPALKDIYYLQILKRGNEAIINEHLVPKKTISPSNTATMDPMSQMHLSKWKTEIENSIKKWKADPNYIAVFPIPIQYQEMGGNARMLMISPEMRMLEETIINSLGVPLEFIKGGASWTGSSISLRIVENHFLTYRELLLDFLNFFLMPKLGGLLGYKPIKLIFKKFKMSDDSESKQLAINLNSSGKISDSRLLDEFGYNYEEEQAALIKSRASMLEAQISEQEKQAEAQGRGQVIIARYQAKSEQANIDEKFKIKAELFQEEIAKELGMIPEDPYKAISKFALELFNMPSEVQQQKFIELQQNMPICYSIIMEKFRSLQLAYAREQNELMSLQPPPPPPPPEEDPNVGAPEPEAPNQKVIGKREQDKIPIREGEKQKGQTRGEP